VKRTFFIGYEFNLCKGQAVFSEDPKVFLWVNFIDDRTQNFDLRLARAARISISSFAGFFCLKVKQNKPAGSTGQEPSPWLK